MWHVWGKCVQSFEDHKEDLGADMKIILKLIIRKYDGKMWTGSFSSRLGPIVNFYEHEIESSSSIKQQESIS
jgi:hypothetical protein